ncbi:MAG: sulfatase-like hydrolase/transferase [Lentisphaerae bacterium]|jgi:arylsulfatase|nr:sulfatase-like hydrolase/transferase [Lentisphaerota bacterium]MBT4821794.1 sulfatase-like hydrolase/transferase [Lentisphaerota bacterium]MBT5609264.1 sulfatase-like hydrolase/transferase [Lentisphaerota bacterium]MBT7059442.1 sulfatase-like hydrolase/transferase [Lentisphaerota bacterium]MBT7847826.1 sulfatase-like hydrolase/transferase [Lentisphaerota bacterium]
MSQPNILFFFPDQHRGDWLASNPALPLRTPNLDGLSARGVTFSRAYCTSPLCAPSRASLAAGKSYDRCRVPDNGIDYPLDQPTYYQALREAGYRVAGVGKFDLHKNTSDPTRLNWNLDGSRSLEEWGFTEGIDNEGKFDGSTSYRVNGAPRGPYLSFLEARGLADTYVQEHASVRERRGAYVTALPDDAYCDNWLSENGLRFLRGFPQGKPWHMVVNFTGPHAPMDVTQSMHDAWAGVDFPPPHRNEQAHYSGEDHQRNRRHYAAMIENIDRQVGRFLDVVRDRGELANTLVVYCSDHGEMLGDHGKWGKCTYREPSVRVPLIVAGPEVRRGLVSDALVAIHDLAATFTDSAGATPMPEMDAVSLWPVLRGESEEHRAVVVSGLRGWRAAVDRSHKLVTGLTEGAVLHDLCADPNEDTNVAEIHPDVVARLSNAIEVAKEHV